MQEKLDEILGAFGIFSTGAQNLLKEKVAIREISRNKNVFTEGRKNDMEYFLLSGVLDRYNISDKGDTVTTGFYLPQSVITPHFARMNNAKSLFSLRALTDVVVAEISVKNLNDLRYNNPEFRQFGQCIVETELSRIFYAEIVSRSYSAKERLAVLRKQYPGLENMVPHNIIASYLGITNVSFSRLRNEMSKR